jgi:plastocyanin
MRRFIIAGFVASTVLAAGTGNAGQSFVSVGNGGNFFGPSTWFVRDQGDVVVWQFDGFGHTVTQGTTGSELTWVFNTNPLGGSQGAGNFFSWKTDRPTVSYYCKPHFAFNMKGSITVVGSTQQEADFRINEVRYDGVGSNFVEIMNRGDGAGDLQGFRLVINGVASTPWTVSTPVSPPARWRSTRRTPSPARSAAATCSPTRR